MSAAEASGPLLELGTAVVKKANTPHYKAAVALGVLIGLGTYCIWLFNVQPFAGYMNPYMLALNGFVKTLMTDVVSLARQAMTYAQAYPVPAFVGGITLFGTVYGIFSKISGDRALAKTKAEANEQISTAQGNLVATSQNLGLANQKITSLQTELDTYKNDTSFQEAQGLIGSLKTTVAQKDATIQELTNLVEDMKLKTVVQVH